MSKWHNGPPPSIGWWVASTQQALDILRWWNGAYWSLPAHVSFTSEEAARIAKHRDTTDIPVQWTTGLRVGQIGA